MPKIEKYHLHSKSFISFIIKLNYYSEENSVISNSIALNNYENIRSNSISRCLTLLIIMNVV